jgi:hypothetical protein
MSQEANSSAGEHEMADSFKKLVCCMLLLALVGTVSGAGYVAAEQAGIAVPMTQPVAGSVHGDKGLSSITGEPGTTQVIVAECHFPIINLPAYYVCIMFCKIGGGGDACAPICEAKLSICT